MNPGDLVQSTLPMLANRKESAPSWITFNCSKQISMWALAAHGLIFSTNVAVLYGRLSLDKHI